MAGQTYLLRSRHGIYYARIVIPPAIRSVIGIPAREVRFSLRTKDHKLARRLLPHRICAMTNLFSNLEASELEADERSKLYKRGLELIRQHGKYDLDDEFELDEIRSELTGDDLRAYIFAIEHRKQQKQNKKARKHASSSVAPSAPDFSLDVSDPPVTDGHSSQRPDEKISVAIERFFKSKASIANDATIAKYDSQCRIFLKIVADGRPDLMLSALNVKDMQHYSDTLHKLPIKISPTDPRQMSEILGSSTAFISDRTRSAHARAVSMFLQWCQEQQYQVQPNLDRILKPLLRKPKVRDIRKHFNQTELKLIFESQDYKCGSITRDTDYWVPLLGLFTGARQAELCQLMVNDVRQDANTSIWIIDINEDGDKRLKNDSSKRQVPIHPGLERLGFLEFVKSASGNKDGRLFPEEHRNNRGEFDAFSKRFNRYLTKVGINKAGAVRLDFHSFRHTLQTDLVDQGSEEYIVNHIVGHTPSKSSQSVKTYSKGAGLKARHDLLLKFRYDTALYDRQGSRV